MLFFGGLCLVSVEALSLGLDMSMWRQCRVEFVFFCFSFISGIVGGWEEMVFDFCVLLLWSYVVMILSFFVFCVW